MEPSLSFGARVEWLRPLHRLFEWADTRPSRIAIRESEYLYSWVLISHVVSMCLFAGLVLMMDLRLLGVGNTRTPSLRLHRALFPWHPLRFQSSFLFWIEVVLLLMAG